MMAASVEQAIESLLDEVDRLPPARPRRRRPLSPEMRELLDALRVKPQAELPGLELGATVRFVGGRWWRIEGVGRSWQTETVLALLRRQLIERVSPRTYRATVQASSGPPRGDG